MLKRKNCSVKYNKMKEDKKKDDEIKDDKMSSGKSLISLRTPNAVWKSSII